MLTKSLIPAGLLLLACCKATEPSTSTDTTAAKTPPSQATAPMTPSTTTTASAPPQTVDTTPPTPPTAGTDADRVAVARGEQAFASRLYAKLRPGDKNLFFSPTSIRMALAMTYAGAKGDTATEIAKTLSLEGDADTIHKGFAAQLRDFADANSAPVPANAPDWQKSEAERKKQTVRVVNRLWGQRGRAFKPDYLSLLQTSYAAPLEQLDFLKETEKSRLTINKYIADQTEQKIKDLIPAGALASDSKLVLTNAVYFKANWEEAFTESLTKEDAFYVSTSKTVRAKLMTETHNFRYAKVGDAQVLELPYASGRMSMIVALPQDKDGLTKLEQGMNDATLGSWVNGLSGAQVHVTLPRFKVTSEFSLAKILPTMGMPTAFDSQRADFSGMDGTKELYIGDVLHKAFVAVDEKGTEAAAATAVIMRAGAAFPSAPPVEFRADHPFVFFLRDAKTGSVLFMGRVTDPTA